MVMIQVQPYSTSMSTCVTMRGACWQIIGFTRAKGAGASIDGWRARK